LEQIKQRHQELSQFSFQLLQLQQRFWNEALWGQNSWGEQSDVNETLTGEVLTSSLGNETVTADCNVTPTGILITAFQGTATEIIAVEAFPSGLSFTANLGVADASPDAIVSGVTASASVGSVEAYNLEGWGRYFYGQFVWGATGDWAQVDLTGISLSANLGNEIISANANATISGIGITAEEGTVDPAPDAEVTGIGFEADLAVGTVIIGEANVVAVGEGIAAGLGLGTLDALADVTGISMSAELGSIANITGHANVFPIGFGLTTALGTNKTLIWNQVDTGTAPVDPPGWQEVAA
jgi:hypothetical protein